MRCQLAMLVPPVIPILKDVAEDSSVMEKEMNEETDVLLLLFISSWRGRLKKICMEHVMRISKKLCKW